MLQLANHGGPRAGPVVTTAAPRMMQAGMPRTGEHSGPGGRADLLDFYAAGCAARASGHGRKSSSSTELVGALSPPPWCSEIVTIEYLIDVDVRVVLKRIVSSKRALSGELVNAFEWLSQRSPKVK